MLREKNIISANFAQKPFLRAVMTSIYKRFTLDIRVLNQAAHHLQTFIHFI